MMFDSAMATQKVYELIILDNSIFEKKKKELTKHYPCESSQDEANFIAEALCFGMSRDFVKRDPKTKNLLSTGKLGILPIDNFNTTATKDSFLSDNWQKIPNDSKRSNPSCRPNSQTHFRMSESPSEKPLYRRHALNCKMSLAINSSIPDYAMQPI